MNDHSSPRLAPPFGQAIEREESFTFTFDGKSVTAYPGDTIGAALAAAGQRVISRSFKYHRPRGLMCGAGHCPNCLVQVGDEPNVRACTRAAAPGLDVRSQNAWPSLERDAMALTGLVDRFLPVGFYYKTFIRPQALWPAYEWLLRRAAGLGRLNPESRPGDHHKQYQHADVVVVGGGPAGLSAAQNAAAHGARVLLLDENRETGGHWRYEPGAAEGAPVTLAELRAALAELPQVTVKTETTVLGAYEDKWLSAVSGDELYKIRAGSVVVATGLYEQPLVFANNDLPGVMLGSGVARLLHLYGVTPGGEAVVVTANENGWQLAADLLAAGVTVRALVDERPHPPAEATRWRAALEAAGALVYQGNTILAAEGNGEVEAAVIAPVDAQGQPSTGATKRVPCDLIAVSVGWTPANGLLYEAGGRMVYDEAVGEFVPQTLPPGIYAAGRVTGPGSAAADVSEGRRAGRQAALFAQQGEAPDGDDDEPAGERVRRTSTLVRVAGYGKQKRGKRFVCFCEDVSDGDVETAIAEGYNSIELLKRYSTISMGPCQGKMCSTNTIHLCARANGWTVAETGTTTARPPTTPVSLGALAGQQMNPARQTPVHAWHEAHGAKMMVAGLWHRPEHYGDPLAEVEAVRQRVGLIDVSTLGKLGLHGPGVPRFLESVYTNRWRKLPVGRVRYGLMCNEEGIILDDGVTARLDEDSYYMTTTSSGAGAVYEWLEWWRQSGWGEGVHVTALTDAYAAFNLAGPRARRVLARLVEEDVSHEAFPYMSAREMTVAGVPCRLLRIGFTGELSYEIHCPAGYGAGLWEALLEAGAAEGIQPFGVEAQRVLRLEKAHLIVGQDTDALSDPFAAGLGWAVKMEKGDFLGRRSLLRQTREEPAQRLTGFKMGSAEAAPAEGVQIVRKNGASDLEIIGHVTSSRYSPTLEEVIGLCWLQASLAQAGTPFTIRLEDGQLVQATVHEGAFYDPEGERLLQ